MVEGDQDIADHYAKKYRFCSVENFRFSQHTLGVFNEINFFFNLSVTQLVCSYLLCHFALFQIKNYQNI